MDKLVFGQATYGGLMGLGIWSVFSIETRNERVRIFTGE